MDRILHPHPNLPPSREKELKEVPFPEEGRD
jgi:hypothetical protein